MDAAQITTKLEQLRDLQNTSTFLQRSQSDAIESIIPAEIQFAIDTIEQEYAAQAAELNRAIGELKSELTPLIVAIGATVKADGIQAIYSKPRVTWDTKALDGFAAAHPEIEKFRKIGNPSVSFR